MFVKLEQFRNQHNTTLVPQCYDQDPRLGRWVHYQRVEYWIYQQSGTLRNITSNPNLDTFGRSFIRFVKCPSPYRRHGMGGTNPISAGTELN